MDEREQRVLEAMEWICKVEGETQERCAELLAAEFARREAKGYSCDAYSPGHRKAANLRRIADELEGK